MSADLSLLTLFVASQVATPGPANMTLLATGARYGFIQVIPFVIGVTVGKQLLVWPLGLGLIAVATQYPLLFSVLKYVSAAYILWLAWRVAQLRLSPQDRAGPTPGFAAGLIVHPLNPKAWGMIIAGLTNFFDAQTSAINATATLAAVLFACQCVLHPTWAYAGDRIASLVAGKTFEPYLMWILAAATAVSVLFVLFS